MKEFIRKHFFVLIFSVTGAVGGFLYWKFVGCVSGTCPIKSVWYLSTLWGLGMGYLLGSIFKDFITKIKARNKISGDTRVDQD